MKFNNKFKCELLFVHDFSPKPRLNHSYTCLTTKRRLSIIALALSLRLEKSLCNLNRKPELKTLTLHTKLMVIVRFRLIDQLVSSEDLDAAVEKETKNWIGKLL